MKQQFLISVIIPVFNTAQYISTCLESVARQQYSNIEVVVVDDGSTDGSSEIIDRFAERDSRFIVKHQQNKGVAESRNEGLRAATGDYIMWLDSDDWIEPDWIQQFVDQIETDPQWDIIVSTNHTSLQTGETILRNYLLSHYPYVLWMTCIRSELYADVHFLPGFHIGEDALALCELYAKARSCLSTSTIQGMHHVDRHDSLSHNPSLGNKIDWIIRGEAELKLIQRIRPSYINFARYDVMRGASEVYSQTKTLHIPNNDHQYRSFIKDLRRFMFSGLMHLPLTHMSKHNYIVALRAIKHLFM